MKKKIQKPFDAEAAKRGAKVETKGGRPVRIVCYDKFGTDYPIVALVSHQDSESCDTYNIKGELVKDETSKKDLVIVEEIEETKFNVGDWVFMNTYGNQPWLVIKVTPNYYEIKDSFGHVSAKSHPTIDSLFHLWTLRDAKPGVVLTCENDNRPFIFKAPYISAPTAYCGIDMTYSIFVGTDNPWTSGPVRPATYEERLQLFNKLEEEGYKWDARTCTLWKKCN